MTIQTALQMSEETFHKIQLAATELGETPSDVMLAAIENYLEERDDVRRAEDALRKIRSGEMRTVTLEEVKRDLGMED
jgi:RHH-type transcriptional regulator, rel operon repressor / antitoxin RelB